MGVIHQGGLYTKNVLMRIYAQGWQGTQGQTEGFKRIFMHLQQKMGVIHQEGYISGITVQETRKF